MLPPKLIRRTLLNDASPVLIVGAGPTGLAAAMSLARAHIPVRLIDKARAAVTRIRAPSAFRRARSNCSSSIGIVEPFLELGHRARVANLYSNGMRLARLDFDPLHTRYPYLLFLDQSVTERLLTEHLATLGVRIERGVELTMFSQGSAGVQATLRHRERARRNAAAVVHDRRRRRAQHRSGIGSASASTGKTFEQTFLLADLHADSDWPDDEFHIFASGEGLAALFPMGHDRASADRGHAVEPPPSRAATPAVLGEPPLNGAAPSLDECRALVARRVHRSRRRCRSSAGRRISI